MFSHGISFQVKFVSVVYKAVEYGVGQGWVADDLMPMLHGVLAGHEGRPRIVAFLDDLQQVGLRARAGITATPAGTVK
jgi:hypothetical protein